MERNKTILHLLPALGLFFVSNITFAQTASSLFWKRDSVQVNTLFAEDNQQYNRIGHHGPAVENGMMGLRLYFNNSGAIDVYSKKHQGLELREYLWYPTEEQIDKNNAGCDEYYVGKSLGLGGIALWDGEKVVRLEMTKGRRARVDQTSKGHCAELISYGVPYKGDFVDISVRIDVVKDSRYACVTASCLNGIPVQFVTGVNYNSGAYTDFSSPGHIVVWGTHPANVSQHPVPIGGGMIYNPSVFPEVSMEPDMIRLISVPSVSVSTNVISACAKEKNMNLKKFSSMVLSSKSIVAVDAGKSDKRNIMLNAESATIPRSINVGLPDNGDGAPIYVDGAKHAHGLPKGYFHWAGGNAYEPVRSISLMESVIRTGEIGVCVDSYTKLGGQELTGDITAQTSINGLIHFDGAVRGPISKEKGWYFSAGAYVHFDPTSVNAPNRPFVSQKQIYQATTTKRWASGELSLMYRFSKSGENVGKSYSIAPFIYNGDGSVSKLNGFRIGRDCYFPAEDKVSYMDIATGNMVSDQMGKMDNIYCHDITLKGKCDIEGWEINSTLHALAMQPCSYLRIEVGGMYNVASGDGYTTTDGQAFEGNVQSRYGIVENMKSTDICWVTEVRKQLGRHHLKTGLDLIFAKQYEAGSSFNFAHAVSADPQRLLLNGNGSWSFNTNGIYLDAVKTLGALYAFDDWHISDRWFLRFGLRLRPGFQSINTAARLEGDGDMNKRVPDFTINNPSLCNIHNLKRGFLDYAASMHVDYRIYGRLFAVAEGFYSITSKSSTYYKNATIPSEKAIGNAMGRAGLNFDSQYFDGSLLFSFITAWNCAASLNQSKGGVTIPWVAEYGIRTPGLTFDGNVHYKGFNLHTLITYQDPRYYNFSHLFDFGDGEKVEINYNNKIVTGISKFMLEFDPSYSWDKVKLWLSVRYFSKQYASRTNLAYFKGRIEAFAGVDWKVNKNHKVSVNVVNPLFQNGVNGNLGIADIITDPKELEGYMMSGTFIRPFSVDFKYTFSF